MARHCVLVSYPYRSVLPINAPYSVSVVFLGVDGEGNDKVYS